MPALTASTVHSRHLLLPILKIKINLPANIFFMVSVAQATRIPWIVPHVCREGKTYERASNAHVHFFLAWVESVPNFTMICRNFALCRVILMALKLINW